MTAGSEQERAGQNPPAVSSFTESMYGLGNVMKPFGFVPEVKAEYPLLEPFEKFTFPFAIDPIAPVFRTNVLVITKVRSRAPQSSVLNT